VVRAIRVIYSLGSRFFSSLTLFVCSAALHGADSAEVQRAASALSSQDYAAAESGFESVLKLEPGNVSALGNLGVVYSRTQRYAQAIDTYRKALRLAPGEKGLITNLGLAYVKQEQFAGALPIFEKLAEDPANLQARELLATCRVSLGQYAQALETLQPLLAVEPGNPAVLYMMGVTLTRLRRTGEAHETFARMMDAVSPAQANFLMGKASYETERFEEAAGFFRKALQADPGLESAHRELGKALISLRDNDGAEKELRLAASVDPEAIYFLGALLSQTRPDEAVALLNRARELNPDFWGPPYYLGRIGVEQGRVHEALPLLERAAKLNPGESAIQYQLGRALQKLGRNAESRAAFARVQELKSKSLQREVDVISPGAKP
jgi:tetratricopeptide (TPR) repeat protein